LVDKIQQSPIEENKNSNPSNQHQIISKGKNSSSIEMKILSDERSNRDL
jgi:hypothetical protein